VERHASYEALQEAEIEAILAEYDEWVAAVCPGAAVRRGHGQVARQ
jgi:hypothetical protein